MRLRPWILLTLLPLTASAQSLTLTVNGSDAGFINGGDCSATETVTYQLTPGSAVCSTLEIWATAGSCGNRPDAGDLSIGTVSQSTVIATPTGTFSFTGDELPVNGGCSALVEQNFQICGTFQYASSTLTGCATDAPFVQPAVIPTFRYDALPPTVPVVSAVNSLDSALSLNLDVSDDTTLVTPRYRDAASDGGTWTTGETFAVGTRVLVDNLVNGVTYEVQARAEDGAGNKSDFSGSGTGKPEALIGFFDNYRSDGGSDTGGCTQAGGSPLWLIAVLPALFAWGRRRLR